MGSLKVAIRNTGNNMQGFKTVAILAGMLALSACNTSNKANLGMSDDVKSTSISSSPVQNSGATEVAEARYKVYFLPITGAPARQVTALSKSLQSTAIQNQITMTSQNQGEKYRVKGFFSAFNDGSGTLVVYVWDILDTNNKRIHRINGRQKIGRTAKDPWSVVSDATMQAIGKTTILKLDAWAKKQN